VYQPATHFAPEPLRLPRTARTRVPTLVSVTALAGVPALVRQAFGETVLRQANRAAMLDVELVEDRDCFIPHATMAAFLAEIERRTREASLGLLLAPHLSLTDYGCWGDYVLGAGTLGAAVARSMLAIGYHSRGDRVTLAVDGAEARLGYLSAARGRPGYFHVALGSAGVILSLCRFYLANGWRPQRIELDVPRPRSAAPFEEAFGCPVGFEAADVAVRFPSHLLDAQGPPRRSQRLVTIEDVARARLEPADRDDLPGVVTAQIRAQLLGGSVSIDSAARALDLSVRTLQRELHRDGTDFRSLTNAVRARRARELLRGTRASVTQISVELGYSTPANFTRAFRNATGLSPDAFRRSATP
jgi:AraC-like DNA-binding protein